MRCSTIARSERGQILVMLALALPLVILFSGLAIDVGLLYVTKAKLSTAVDAACLTGMKNLSLGQVTAASLATHVFNANFGDNPPTPAITFPTDAAGDQQVAVQATATVNTVLMRYLPQFATLNVSDGAIATRGKLVMSVVLDRSGSMKNDGGEAALQSAVPNFVSNFSNTNDEVAMISFASNATVDFSINYNFITPITNAVKALNPSGGTFGTGAGNNLNPDPAKGPPLSLAKQQNDSVVPQQGQNVTKVVVYFTDGLMNTMQDIFNCPAATLINYGGYDVASSDNSTTPDFFDPANGTDWGTVSKSGASKGALPYKSGSYCKGASGQYVTTFYSQANNQQESFIQSKVTAETQYRALVTAAALRTESPIPTYIYVIGLGSGVSAATQAFLANIANDPAYPATYDPNQAAGLFLYVPNCPSATCTADLNTAFDTIAAKILLRLTK
jgi:Flp pilus assembly protein TadG